MKFSVIVADPPWSFNDKMRMSDNVKRGAEDNYVTMTNADIAALDVSSISAPDSICVLWYPSVLLAEALQTLQSWGFVYKQQWHWIKTGKCSFPEDEIPQDLKLAFGMGRLARNCSESMLVGIKGKVYPHLKNKSQRNVFLAPNIKHSVKPECVQDALESMFPDMEEKLELFARRDRDDWFCVGNECPSTKGMDVRKVLKWLSRKQ